MCVTSGAADTSETSAYTLLTDQTEGGQPIHITAYQTRATNLQKTGGNCIVLHYPAQDTPRLVGGPERTKHLMRNVTWSLAVVEYSPLSQGVSGWSPATRIQEYGDYHVVFASSALRIIDALLQVPEDRRPLITPEFENMIEWYLRNFPDHRFVLPCFGEFANPRHPIVVSYVPLNDDVLFVPGISVGDDGLLHLGKPIERDLKVAFGIKGFELPINVDYHDAGIDGRWWAPETISGFHDNRRAGSNDDYVIALDDLREGLEGAMLLAQCIP